VIALPPDPGGFVALLGGVFEHSPWVAERAWDARPFASVDALHAAMVAAVESAGETAQLALLCAHPELARPGPLTAASQGEQGGLGLDAVAGDEAARFAHANELYRARFGFPFIIAVRGQRDRGAILRAMEERLGNGPDEERRRALAEVGRIARFRLDDLLGDDADG
jgi:2-oxo-4-hydroxy-4-carboxy-5-ureidoimidazoline decarboxylase